MKTLTNVTVENALEHLFRKHLLRIDEDYTTMSELEYKTRFYYFTAGFAAAIELQKESK